ncbi:MAG: hypothetical protein K5636_05840 [Bacteroidales bacterium]|nr:hypothetical protein [Bacteroidales bacterium]
MKKLLLFFLILLSFASCKNKRDKVVAQVYYHKLYLSEVLENTPSGLSPEDSVALAHEYMDNWVKENLVLHEAEKKLSVREKNFDKKMEEYRNSLLINAYFDKLVSDTSNFKISQEELDAFTKNFDKRYTVDKDIVKLNYVKLSKNSKLIAPVKAILFDESRRQGEREALTKMLGDSVEYLLDDDTWLYLDDIRNEVPFEVKESDLKSHNQYVDKTIEGNRYLLVILDYKNQRSVSETQEEMAAARMMLVNQRKRQFIEQHVNQLYEKALKEGAITQ